MDGKRYFWLRLHDDFFRSVRIKKLRRMAGGDTYCIIYLKMQLKAMKTDGVLTWRGYEQDFVDELALDLDESPDDVRVTLAYLLSCGLATTEDKVNFVLPYAIENTGSEGASAERMRNLRKRQASLSDAPVTQPLRLSDGEKEIDKEKDIEIEKEIKGGSGGKSKFSPPTLEDVKAYCTERRNNVDAERFFNYYTSNGWRVGKNPMKDWKAAVRTWERDGKTKPQTSPKPMNDDVARLVERLGVNG